jgi:hypothetical protein
MQSEPKTPFLLVNSVITEAGGNPLKHAAEDKMVETRASHPTLEPLAGQRRK